MKHESEEGYAFDGFLSRFPPPAKGMKLEAYVRMIRAAHIDVYRETISRDWGGYFQDEESIVLKTENWAEAFLIAKQLFDIPSKLGFPGASTEPKTVLVNPDKAEYVWSDEITAVRKEDGSFSEITYEYRTMGGGKTIMISYDARERGIRLSGVSIGD